VTLILQCFQCENVNYDVFQASADQGQGPKTGLNDTIVVINVWKRLLCFSNVVTSVNQAVFLSPCSSSWLVELMYYYSSPNVRGSGFLIPEIFRTLTYNLVHSGGFF